MLHFVFFILHFDITKLSEVFERIMSNFLTLILFHDGHAVKSPSGKVNVARKRKRGRPKFKRKVQGTFH